jgi:hypothetical protein
MGAWTAAPTATSPLFGLPHNLNVALRKWLAEFGQLDKSKICLRAAMVPRIRWDLDARAQPAKRPTVYKTRISN